MAIIIPPPPTSSKQFDDNGKMTARWKQWWDLLFKRIGGATTGLAPDSASYIVQTPDAGLGNEQALSTLDSGFVKVVTGTGALTSTASNLIRTQDLAVTGVSPGPYSVNQQFFMNVDVDGRILGVVPNFEVGPLGPAGLDLTGTYPNPGVTSVLQSTGLISGGLLSVGSPNTTFNVAAGTGVIVDNSTVPGTVTRMSWDAFANVPDTFIASGPLTYVAIDSTGAIVQQATRFTNIQQRQMIVLGVTGHADLATITTTGVVDIHPVYSPASNTKELAMALNIMNITGNIFSANGANLSINRTAGSTFRMGSNYPTNHDSPNIASQTAASPQTFNRTLQTDVSPALSVTTIDPDNYDLAGVLTAVPNNKFTVQRIFLFVAGFAVVQYGQAVYNSLAEATAALQTEAFVVGATQASTGLLRGYLVVKQGATALNDPTKATFFAAGKFGADSQSAGGLSVSTFQNAYDNSSAPQVTTSTTLGDVQFKRGSAADTDIVMSILNGAGTKTWSVSGNGAVTLATWNGNAVGPTFGGTGLTTYAQGDLLYSSATNTLAKLAKDTNATRYLSNQGTSNNPSWNQVNLTNGVTGVLPRANGGSDWVLISTATVSSSASVSFTGLSSTYSAYKIVFSGVDPATAGADLRMRISTDNGANYLSTAIYFYAGTSVTTAAASTNFGAGSATQLVLLTNQFHSSGQEAAGGEIMIVNPSDATTYKKFLWSGYFFDNTGPVSKWQSGGGLTASTTAVNAVQLLMSTGNIATGSFKLYGIVA